MLKVYMTRVAFLVVGFIFLTGCVPETIYGNGVLANKTVAISDISKIEINAAGVVNIKYGSTESVTVSAEQNILDNMISEQSGSTFKSRPAKNKILIPNLPVTYEITVVKLDEVCVDGSLKTNIDGVNGSDFFLKSNGTGSTTMVGNVQRLVLEMTGTTSVKAGSLPTNQVSVAMTGITSAEVNVSTLLLGMMSGQSELQYRGNAVVTVQTAQMAKITKII